MDFKPGDLVQLRSGGPRMTVQSIDKDPKTQEDVVICTWFENVGKRQERQTEAFPPAVLAQALPHAGQIRLHRG
jgi:uncharacterized protein YodC (DUF2158 family)